MDKKYGQYRFFLQPSQSPTYYNLCKFLKKEGWNYEERNHLANFNEQNFEFYLPAAECLEFKHLLSKLVDQYCPQIMPQTYCINDQNWPSILNHIEDAYYNIRKISFSQKAGDLTWILKPSLLNNGQNIKIFQNMHQVEQHYLNANRLGGEHVLQHYITNPHLLKGPRLGHKYSIRMFVILTNYAGAYLYPYGYFNIALNAYQATNFTDIRPHLTNEHLIGNEYNVVQIPTKQYDLFKPFYPKIKNILTPLINGLRKMYPCAFIPENKRTLSIFGFDFMVDSHSKVWLLEANHGPCFPTNDDHPLQKGFYYDFWQSVILDFIFPISCQKNEADIQYKFFERIDI